MKVYNEIVFDVDGNVTYEDSYEYSGDVTLCIGKFPDYNEDGGVNVLDIIVAPESRRQEVIDMVLNDTFTGDLGDYAASEKSRASELLLSQSGALTANPLPSMTSISNIGAAPFSGSINWNAIPGGFQPLPQVVGGKKRLYQLSQFHGGVNQKSSSRDISDQEAQEATNVTVSQIGRIKLLGDIKSTSSTLSTAEISSSATHIPSPGYGLYVFKSGYSLAAAPVQGDYTIVVSTDGEHVVATDGTTQIDDDDAWLTIANEAIDVAPTFYASGNGLYVCDANLDHTTSRKAAILVYRKDYDSATPTNAANLITKKWVTGEALINSPRYEGSAITGGSSGADGSVNLEWDDGNSGAAFVPTTTVGSATVHISSGGSGNWDGNYFFYISWLFDNGCETGLTALQLTGGSYASGYTFADEKLFFNFSVQDDNSTRNHIGGDARIHGARIYFREAGTVERYTLAEVSLQDGIKGSLDTTFAPWDEPATDKFDLAANIEFESPPTLNIYSDWNVFSANEMYDKSPETLADNTVGPAPHDVRYRTSAVGSNGAVFIGCYMFRQKLFADGMMYSMPNQPGVFPEFNTIDSPSSDGTPITVLVAFKDKILQFKQDALYVLNISNPSQFYTEGSFRNCGIMNPCQAFQTPFGVIFVNQIGCFIYDGSKVISLTSGKFTIDDWGISEGTIVDTAESGSREKDAVKVPCVGYDARSQSIVVLKDVGDNGTSSTTPDATGAWIYHMGTQSWTEGTSMITNTNSDRHTNFIISPNGYLSILHTSGGSDGATTALKTYDIGEGSSNVQTITYWTKDLDFGMPSQTKRLFKVYITYKGDGDSLTCAYGVNGETDTSDLYHFATDGYGGTTDTTPLLDKSSAENEESWHVATLYPDDSTEGKDWKSISLYFNGSVGETFEINDISIMYRPRPIK